MGSCTRYDHLPAHARPRNRGLAVLVDDGVVGYLVQRRRSLILVCWRCKRRTILTPEQIRDGATRGPDEEIRRFASRCRCTGCQARGPKFRYEGEPRPSLHDQTYTRQGTLRDE